ncbi:type I restriction enzyme HsdR N-terminal domain-containing protein [Bordetella bronchialis]|uniref:S1 motif domain-containing protein n=1 Tax=Bordetella bronchialis TaxID=463025 RepID=A0ABM6CUV2_9BORD|nr:type I restriction enzyme HsdR N-terminal domain-containing protein [Bordetella bronchialis]ANN67867.1 hypothetical protein BAU06_17590 [Bordetella bronchialis]
MFQIPVLKTLHTESDVEQKLIFPLLTTPLPYGLGIPQAQILTKLEIRRLDIGKGNDKKRYFPDYIVTCEALPLFVIEAKEPSADVLNALREARLYANAINSKFPSGFNPVYFVAACNGIDFLYGAPDSDDHISIPCADLTVSHQVFGEMQQRLAWQNLRAKAVALSATLKPQRFWKPKKLLGGNGVQTEEVGHNSFGSTLSAEYGHIFSPEDVSDRAEIARHAYVDSRASQRAIEPIDRVIRAARPNSETLATTIGSTANPTELLEKLKKTPKLEGKVILLIGSVGSGKSTFVDHLIYKVLPDDLLATTLWCRVNMNKAPASKDEIYKWLRAQIADGCKRAYPDEDFDSLESSKKVYSVEVNRFEKVQGRLLKEAGDLQEYTRRLVELLTTCQADGELTSKAISRYCCGERGKLLVVVLDNCDKRSRDEQLLMFQAAQWIQSEYRALIVLPLREETFEAHQDEKPLDTAVKDLTFRIEPPLFQHVLVRRVQLALSKMKSGDERTLSYDLPNGFTVTYPPTEQAYYLSSIVRSLFEHDRFIRRMITGLSGKNIRKALEIFMDFCNSAHLSEDEIFRIRSTSGQHTLPLYLVTRILLRGNLRFYDESASPVKSLFNIFHYDSAPFYFTRLVILRWLSNRFHQTGPNGTRGYFPVREMRAELLKVGVPDYAFDRELDFLIKAQCITSETLSNEKVDENDLVRLSAAGHVHLDLLGNVDYLATVAEDTWFDDRSLASRIAERIGRPYHHLQVATQLINAKEFADYLKLKLDAALKSILIFREDDAAVTELLDLSKAVEAVDALAKNQKLDEWLAIEQKYYTGSVHRKRIVNRTMHHGIFVEMEPGFNGLIFKDQLPESYMTDEVFFPNEEIDVKVKFLDRQKKRIGLAFSS